MRKDEKTFYDNIDCGGLVGLGVVQENARRGRNRLKRRQRGYMI